MLKSLLGGGALSEDVKGELRTFLLQMRHERSNFETAAKEAQAALERAQEAAEPATRVAETLNTLEERLQAVEQIAASLPAMEARAAQLADAQEQTGADISELGQAAHGIRSDLNDLKGMMHDAQAVKADLQDILDLGGRMQEMRSQMTTLSERMEAMTTGFEELQLQQGRTRDRETEAQTRLAEMEGTFDSVRQGFEALNARAETLETAVNSMNELATGIPDVRRELGTLRALGEYVTQKISALEEQREAVDYAANQGERLGEIMRRVDKELQAQQQNMKFLGMLHDQVEELRTAHTEMREETDGICERHTTLLEENQEQQRKLADLKVDLQREVGETVERFRLEREGMESVSAQVLDLGQAVAALEHQMAVLGAARDAAAEVAVNVEGLSGRLEAIDAQLPALEAHVSEARSARAEVRTLRDSVRELGERVNALREPSLHKVDEAERRVADLNAGMSGLEARAEQLQGFSERVRAVSLEAEQRQATVEHTLADLERATALRDEAGHSVASLSAEVRALTEGLTGAESRLEEIRSMHTEMDRHAVSLDETRERLARFEARLAEWHSSEMDVQRALEDVHQRQATLDAIKADFRRLFDVASETAESVRGLAMDRAEIGRSREGLDRVMQELESVRTEASRLEARRLELEQADSQVARIEALMIDVQSTLDTLQRQRSFLDQVVETAGSLRFQSKQAEALITTLREERDFGGGTVGE